MSNVCWTCDELPNCFTKRMCYCAFPTGLHTSLHSHRLLSAFFPAPGIFSLSLAYRLNSAFRRAVFNWDEVPFSVYTIRTLYLTEGHKDFLPFSSRSFRSFYRTFRPIIHFALNNLYVVQVLMGGYHFARGCPVFWHHLFKRRLWIRLCTFLGHQFSTRVRYLYAFD